TSVAASSGVATFATLSLDKLGNGYTLVASATGLTQATSATFRVTTLPLLGSTDWTGPSGGDMAVNPNGSLVFIAGGMNESGLVRVNAANPQAMTQTSLSNGGGVAVDAASGRYATTGGGTLLVYNADDSLHDSQVLNGTGGLLDCEPATGRFFVSSTTHVTV